MRKILRIVEDNRASSGVRFVNYTVDLIVLIVINTILSFVSVWIYNYTSINFFYFYNNGGLLWEFFCGNLVSFIYYFLWENYSNGRTVGKYITNTMAISTDGVDMTTQQVLYRTLCRIVPFDALSFLGGGNGWHDNWTDTRVINIKNYVAEKQAKEEINSIGTKENA
ncbi:RDD family protein [Chryseobacterium sp. G0201]|uniref:RDD family protein n=1 Tax=Chryseobacterium sp. G0201 TaxID=2487065 RepID=UPI000F4E9D29|nr:RDD family protein [Chryseobacterium sp. G0201]AZA52048.1 RDD family protein [Chryseobacterium sp. G0201]